MAIEWSELGLSSGDAANVEKIAVRFGTGTDISFLAYNANSMTEGCKDSVDTDEDGTPDFVDLDSDNDTVVDGVDARR